MVGNVGREIKCALGSESQPGWIEAILIGIEFCDGIGGGRPVAVRILIVNTSAPVKAGKVLGSLRNLDGEKDCLAERVAQSQCQVVRVKIACTDGCRPLNGSKGILEALFQIIPWFDQVIPKPVGSRRWRQ